MFEPNTVAIEFTPEKYNTGKKFLKVLKEFSYTDKHGYKWTVPADYLSDGGSIPKWAQRFIGEPLEGDTLRAVLVHDVYCDNQSRSQKDTHKVFREIMKIDGGGKIIRNLMYTAVVKYNKFENPDWK